MFSKVKIAFFLIALAAAFSASAQIGASGSQGGFLNYPSYIATTITEGGDYEVSTSGMLQIANGGTVEVYGALVNNGTIEIDSNGVLSVWGDVVNNATIIAHKGAKINFYGRNWKNAPAASVVDGFDPNTVAGGDLNFIGLRPAAAASWLAGASYISSYSGGNERQYHDGGNVNMDVNLHIQNENSVALQNTNTRIEGQLSFDMANGNVILGDNNLVFTTNASQSGFAQDRYLITNGQGHVTKENFNGQWIFPVGRDVADYTPAAIDNNTANTFHVMVQDFDHSASVENTATSVQDGVLRTWNMYADNATGVSTITLQHNKATNQADFSSDRNYVTRWSDLAKNLSGDKASVTAWQNNVTGASVTGNLSSTGDVENSEMRSRTYRTFATSPNDPTAYITKASLAFKPKTSADILDLEADSAGCDVNLAFTTGKENNVVKFQLQHSTDGKTFSTIYTFEPNGDSSTYDYKHLTAVQGVNYYRIVMLEPSGDYTVSKVVSTTVHCGDTDPVIVLFPNPTVDYINLTGLIGNSQIRIMNMHGRMMYEMSSTNQIEKIDVRNLPAATYIVEVLTGKTLKKTAIKFIKY
ncbi:T9SS type A sorting domain-containing protein [Rurimicrobium arvi]|uniref:Secretion system C-terminal sorting domain-containing protein n=1 Tax=Rurimicrobium arvi TaxID=2049916 RepID=A0ABP8MQQ6_9BACT